jgi:hypothetical protein
LLLLLGNRLRRVGCPRNAGSALHVLRLGKSLGGKLFKLCGTFVRGLRVVVATKGERAPVMKRLR